VRCASVAAVDECAWLADVERVTIVRSMVYWRTPFEAIMNSASRLAGVASAVSLVWPTKGVARRP
jgi:hypothetical protein